MDELRELTLLLVDHEVAPEPGSRASAAARLDELIAGAGRGFRRSARFRRPIVLVAAAAFVLAVSAWTAARFELHLFDASNTPPTPSQLRSWFEGQNDPEHRIDVNSITAIGTFSSGGKEITIYAARGSGQGDFPVGFETIYATSDGKPITGMSYWPPPELAKDADKRLLLSSNSLNGMFDGLWQLWGIAPANTETVAIRFRDGKSTTVPVHHGLFAYVAGGDRCKPGHEPVEVVALARDRSIIDRDESQVSPGC